MILSSPTSQNEASFSDVKMQTLTDEQMATRLLFLVLWKFSISEKTIYYKFIWFCRNCILFMFFKKDYFHFYLSAGWSLLKYTLCGREWASSESKETLDVFTNSLPLAVFNLYSFTFVPAKLVWQICCALLSN